MNTPTERARAILAQVSGLSELATSERYDHLAGPLQGIVVKALILAERQATERAAKIASEWKCIDENTPRQCLIFTEKWGVTEGLRFDSGKWGLACFNGQTIEVFPLLWCDKPPPPAIATQIESTLSQEGGAKRRFTYSDGIPGTPEYEPGGRLMKEGDPA